MASSNIFDYKASDFLFDVPNHSFHEGVHSDFDKCLLSKWNKAHDSGLCKYFLQLECKTIPGNKGYVAQMNAQRKERRAPQSFHSVNMPFDPDKFNFTKIKVDEILFQVQKQSVIDDNCNSLNVNSNGTHEFEDMFIINVSPFAVGHSLVVPNLSECRAQVLTLHALELGVEMQSLSACPNFYVVFNGMCAHASVNHLHLHCYYFNVKKPSQDRQCNGSTPAQKTSLPVQRDDLSFQPVSKSCFVCHSMPVPAIVFQVLSAAEISVVSTMIHLVTQYFVKEGIAHNLCVVKARKIQTQSGTQGPIGDDFNAIRIFLWPRRKMAGAKIENRLNAAACELSGHVFLQPDLYENITEETWEKHAANDALPPDEFNAIVEQVKGMLNH